MPPPLIFHCRWFLFIVLAGALPTLANAQDEWLDRSHAVFFPPKLGERIHTYHQFPATWWNFVTVKANPEKSKGQADPHLLCDHLIRRNANKDIQIVCGNRLDFVQPQLARWAADISIRSPYPGSKIFMQQLNAGLAKASLPLGKDLLVLIRSDPFSAYKDYRAIVEKKKVIGLPQDRGVFVDQERGRWAIPVRFQSPPSEAAQIQKFYETLEKACQVSNQCEGVGFVGPHASTYRNQNQIQKDLKRIGWIGPLVIVLFALLLWLFRLHRYILFFPPILLGIGISVVATVSFFGSIHGLTLSFGAGIIGLCLDYGLHGAFGAHEKQTWKTNTISLATTVVILLVVALSSIPLLRQMMFFSAVGLINAFLFTYVLQRFFPKMFSFTPIRLFKGSPVAIGIFALLLAVVGLASPALLHPQLDMAQFDFHTAESKKNSQWFFENFVSSSVLFEIHDTRLGPHIQESYRRFDFARKHKIPLEGVGAYVPTLETQERNLITWRNSLCKTHQPEWKGSTTTQKDFFAPFLRDLRCQPMTMSESAPPLYVDHLHSDGKWLTLWLPASEEQASLVRTTFPMAYSLRDWVKQFPETLASEIRWMVPFSLAAMFALLLIYFRNIGLAGTSLLSFLTAVGFVTGGHVLLGWTYSFVSLVGTLMICGMSVDYGIFMTDFQRNKNRNKQVAAVQSSILLAALTNILAFIPLLFCQHPVLIHLGRTLILGTAGAYIGAIWGIPFLATLLMRKHPATA